MSGMRWMAGFVAAGLAALASGQQLSIVPGPPANFIDISLTGTDLNLTPEGEVTFVTTIGNAVLPAGPIRIANNGGIGFDALNGLDLLPANGPLPNAGAFNGTRALLPFWDDIGNTVGDVYVQEFSDRLIVQWHDRRFESGVEPNDPCIPLDTSRFQVQIFDNVPAPGTADDLIYALFVYDDIEQPRAGGGISATIGFQNGPGGEFNDVVFSLNQAGAVNEETSFAFAYLPEPGTALLLAGLMTVALRRR